MSIKSSILRADGYDPDEMDDQAQQAAGDVGSYAKNALATLVAVGARVTPMAASQNAEAIAREDRRRQLRTIDTFLAKQYDVDVARTAATQKSTQVGDANAKKMNAFDVAKLRSVAFAHEGARKVSHSSAKHARNQLRAIQRTRPIVFFGSDDKDDGGRRQGEALDTNAQAELLAEMAAMDALEVEDDDLEEGGGEDAENDEEDGEEDEEELAA